MQSLKLHVFSYSTFTRCPGKIKMELVISEQGLYEAKEKRWKDYEGSCLIAL